LISPELEQQPDMDIKEKCLVEKKSGCNIMVSLCNGKVREGPKLSIILSMASILFSNSESLLLCLHRVEFNSKEIYMKFQLPDEGDAPVLNYNNPRSISSEPEQEPELEIIETIQAKKKPAEKRSLGESDTEEGGAPAKKRPRKPKPPSVTSASAAAPHKQNQK
jgi:hypothetical protein